MKRIAKLMIVLLLVLSGCGKSEEELKEEKQLEKQEQRDKAWDVVNKSVDKLKSTQFTGEGYTTEVAHIQFSGFEDALDSKDSSSIDENALDGIFESFNYTIDYKNQEQAQYTKKSLLFGQLTHSGKPNAYISWGIGDEKFEVPASFETLKSDLTGIVSKEYTTGYTLKKNVLTRDNGKTYEYEDKTIAPEANPTGNSVGYDQVRYFNFMDLFKYEREGWEPYGFFMSRGSANNRLLDRSVFDGTVKKTDKETIVTFTFDEKDEENKSYIKSHDFGSMVDIVEHNTGKASLNEEFVSAKIVVHMDAEGYLTSYYREGIWEYKKQNTKIPYVQSFTFKRT